MIEDSSAAVILARLRWDHEDGKRYSSRLLNRQMKSIIYNTCQDLTSRFLIELEKLFKKRQRSLWAITFAAMILVCTAIEQVQTITDAHVQVVKSTEPNVLARLDNEPRESCSQLDDTVYGQLNYIFHTIYRTTKGERNGLNPFTEKFSGNDEEGFDDAAMSMVREIQQNGLDKGGKSSIV
jgi:hypothetical protein